MRYNLVILDFGNSRWIPMAGHRLLVTILPMIKTVLASWHQRALTKAAIEIANARRAIAVARSRVISPSVAWGPLS